MQPRGQDEGYQGTEICQKQPWHIHGFIVLECQKQPLQMVSLYFAPQIIAKLFSVEHCITALCIVLLYIMVQCIVHRVRWCWRCTSEIADQGNLCLLPTGLLFIYFFEFFAAVFFFNLKTSILPILYQPEFFYTNLKAHLVKDFFTNMKIFSPENRFPLLFLEP
jgi:hypothetical protein